MPLVTSTVPVSHSSCSTTSPSLPTPCSKPVALAPVAPSVISSENSHVSPPGSTSCSSSPPQPPPPGLGLAPSSCSATSSPPTVGADSSAPPALAGPTVQPPPPGLGSSSSSCSSPSRRRQPPPAPPPGLEASEGTVSTDTPTRAELHRRVELALRHKGRYMQKNILSQQIRRGRVLTAHELSDGTFVEAFAGVGRVAIAASKGGRRAVAYEAFPGADSDSGLKAAVYLAQYDLCDENTLVRVLFDVYSRRITSIHFGTPCHSWSTLYQNCGPGQRSRTRWWGDPNNAVEILGNRTIGATVLVMRALFETGGTFSLEHPLRSRIWGLKCFEAIMGWAGVGRTRIDQCEFGLAPGDAPSKRYLKPTYILHYSPQRFASRLCSGNHEHVKIESGYRLNGKTIRRSQEAGEYPTRFARALAGIHVGLRECPVHTGRGQRGCARPRTPPRD